MPAHASFFRVMFAVLIVIAMSLGVFLTSSPTLRAAPLSSPIERNITDIFGRTISARIVAVSETTLTIESLAGGTRYDLIIDNLSDVDRQFAKELQTKILPSPSTTTPPPSSPPPPPPLPDTPWLAQVRRDFRILDPKTDRSASPPINYWPTQRWFIIYVTASLPPLSTLQYELGKYRTENAGLLILYSSISRTDFPDQVLAKLPPGAALLSREAFESMSRPVARICEDYQEQWFKNSRNRRSGSPVQTYSPTDTELASLHQRLLRRLPPYWPCAPFMPSAYGDSPHNLWPSCHIYSRDGNPAQFRGTTAAGNIHETILVTNTKRSELQ